MGRKYLLIIIGILGLFTTKTYSQATTTLSIDSISQLTPIIMGDTTDFLVRVRVDNFLGVDTISGDIFYYYQTDSMVLDSAPPRILEQDLVTELIIDSFIDIVHVDIRPDEIRTSSTNPLNLIVIWPAMFSPAVLDTDSVVLYIEVEGFLDIPNGWNLQKTNVIFPCPALQFIYIRQEEIYLIEQIKIISMNGELIRSIPKNEFKQGWINIDELKTGNYIAYVQYKTGSTTTLKFIKQ